MTTFSFFHILVLHGSYFKYWSVKLQFQIVSKYRTRWYWSSIRLRFNSGKHFFMKIHEHEIHLDSIQSRLSLPYVLLRNYEYLTLIYNVSGVIIISLESSRMATWIQIEVERQPLNIFWRKSKITPRPVYHYTSIIINRKYIKIIPVILTKCHLVQMVKSFNR